MGESSTDAGCDKPSKDDIFHILSNDRRRHTLHYLMQENGSASKRDISRQVAAWEYGIPPEQVSSQQRKRVYISLHQTHLPQMDKRGIVDYNPSGQEVNLTDDVDELQVYLDVVYGKDIPWSEFYLGLGMVSLAAVAATGAGIVPFTAFPPLAWAAIIAGAFTVTAVYHVYNSRRHALGRGGPPPEVEQTQVRSEND